VGERIGSLGEVRPSKSRQEGKDTAEEIARELAEGKSVAIDRGVEQANLRGKNPPKLNKYGELLETNEE
jgi:hypothetical protein